MNDWPIEHVDALKELLAMPGLSFAAVADKMNGRFGTRYSRSAVMGKANRAGLSTVKMRATVGPKPVVEPKRGALSSGLIKAIRNRTGEDAALSGAEAKELPREDLPERVSLLEARDGQCRWPAADDGSASVVCGYRVLDGRSWCPHHAALSVRRAASAMEEA